MCMHAPVQPALDGDDSGHSGVHFGYSGDRPLLRGGKHLALDLDHYRVRVGAARFACGAGEQLLQLPCHPGGDQPREPGCVRRRLHLFGESVLGHLGDSGVRDGALGHHQQVLLQERGRGGGYGDGASGGAAGCGAHSAGPAHPAYVHGGSSRGTVPGGLQAALWATEGIDLICNCRHLVVVAQKFSATGLCRMGMDFAFMHTLFWNRT